MKKLEHSDFREAISLVLRNELGKPVDPEELKIVARGVANFVYTFSFKNENYFVKFFPEFFRGNQLVAKPEGSFYRESWVYEIALSSNCLIVPELIHKSDTSPLLVTREWGRTDLFETIDDLSVDKIFEEVTHILVAAQKLMNLLSDHVPTAEIKKGMDTFSGLQNQYLISNPIGQMHLEQLEIDSFHNDYLSLNEELVIGDLSLKNILFNGSEIRFCDFESIFRAPAIFDVCYLIADILTKLEKGKHQEFIEKIYDRFYPELSLDEQKVFFRLLAVCISYRNSNKLNNKSISSLDVREIQSIFYMK